MHGKKQEKENIEYTMLDEIKENEIPKAPKNQNVQQQHQHVSQTHASVGRIYTKLSRPFEWYSLSLYYWLLTDYDELDSYQDTM